MKKNKKATVIKIILLYSSWSYKNSAFQTPETEKNILHLFFWVRTFNFIKVDYSVQKWNKIY